MLPPPHLHFLSEIKAESKLIFCQMIEQVETGHRCFAFVFTSSQSLEIFPSFAKMFLAYVCDKIGIHKDVSSLRLTPAISFRPICLFRNIKFHAIMLFCLLFAVGFFVNERFSDPWHMFGIFWQFVLFFLSPTFIC